MTSNPMQPLTALGAKLCISRGWLPQFSAHPSNAICLLRANSCFPLQVGREHISDQGYVSLIPFLHENLEVNIIPSNCALIIILL